MPVVTALLCSEDGSPLSGDDGMPLVREVGEDVNLVVLPVRMPRGAVYSARAFANLNGERRVWCGIAYAVYREVT